MGMKLTEMEHPAADRIYKKKGETLWNYIPAGKAKEEEITPQKIAGDVGCVKAKDASALLAGGEDGENYPVAPFKAKLGYSQKVLGYIPCEDEEGTGLYVRVLGRSWPKILLPLALLLALLLGALWWFLLRDRGPDLDEAAIAYQMPGGVKNEDPSQIMLPGFGTIKMEAGQREVQAALSNPEGNPCYFKYTVSLEDTGEVLYESGWLKPGTAVTEWEINKELEEGEYPISLLVDTGSLEDYEKEMNKGTIKATLQVGQEEDEGAGNEQ